MLEPGRVSWDTGYAVGWTSAERQAAAELGIELPPDETPEAYAAHEAEMRRRYPHAFE